MRATPTRRPRRPSSIRRSPQAEDFDLTRWEQQEPIGALGSPTTIKAGALAGTGGFHDAYFFTDPTDGAMTFWGPENGVHTANSSYPRSELRELNADGSLANWTLAGTHTMSATFAVVRTPVHVCAGQIHAGAALAPGLATTVKPPIELYYYANGDLKLGIEQDPATGSQTSHTIGHVPLGKTFAYSIQLHGDASLTIGLNGTTSSFATPASFSGYGEYFKAGSYNQSVGTDPTSGSRVRFYALSVMHARHGRHDARRPVCGVAAEPTRAGEAPPT